LSNTAYIRDIESLEQLRIAIARFCEESENQLQAIDSKLQTRIGNLKSLESQFQRMVEIAQNDLRVANNSLSFCESNTYEDEDGNTVYPDCDNEREGVITCRRSLDLVEHNYNSFKREIRNLEISIAEYQNPKIKYKTLIQFEKEAATSSLKQLINGAEDYLSVTSQPMNPISDGLTLTEGVAKIDPTMIIAASIGVAEILMMSVFTFLGLGGKLFSVTNKSKNGVITTTYKDNVKEYTCSELKIEKNTSGNFGKIVSINVPLALQSERIGKNLINNLEAICRANDCKEISGWASSNNKDFYKELGYQTRNEIKENGTEVFKPLESVFGVSQQRARDIFENSENSDFIGSKYIGKQQINPLNIISPEVMNDEKFWQQHGENQNRYFELVEKYEKCNKLLEDGKTLDEIRKEDSWVANAYDVFHGSEPIRLIKFGNYYRIDGNGRHRVAAAQMYYLHTGKSIPLFADVFEKK
jgi:hypothetical protein